MRRKLLLVFLAVLLITPYLSNFSVVYAEETEEKTFTLEDAKKGGAHLAEIDKKENRNRSRNDIKDYIKDNYNRLSAENEEFVDAFYESYKAAREDKDPGSKEEESAWYRSGKKIGETEGEKQATLDLNSNIPKDPLINMPSEMELIQTYRLYRLRPDELRDFLDGFRDGFGKGYDDKTIKDIEKTEDLKGKEIGETYGQNQALKDYYQSLDSNPNRSIPSEGEIVSKFNLTRVGLKERRAFVEAFKEAYISSYNAKYAELMVIDGHTKVDDATKKGKSAGEEYAKIMANSHYQNGKPPSRDELNLSDSEIIAMCNIGNLDKEYIETFVLSFKNAYSTKYDEAYRALAIDEGNKRMEGGSSNGSSAGAKKGEIDANIDLMKSLPYSPERNMPSREGIIAEFNLSLMEDTYAEDFVAGYIEAYKSTYDSEYKKLQGEMAKQKRFSGKIPIAGEKFENIDGEKFKVIVPGGAYYDDAFLTVTTLPSKFLTNLGFIEASKPYKVEITNPNGNFNKNRKIEIRFEYHGDAYNRFSDGRGGHGADVGIYMLQGRTWKYIDTRFENKPIDGGGKDEDRVRYRYYYDDINHDGSGALQSVYVRISPETLLGDGAVFALLVDKSYDYLYDIRGHWARNEINAMIRRGVIVGYSDKTFRPDKPITRAEFLTLLSRHYGWNVGELQGFSSQFVDKNTFGYYTPYIDYGAGQGYIIGYTDGTFKPNRNITYEEVDWIMQRVTGNYKFKWEDYAKMLVNKKGVRSKSYNSIKNKITRAEFSYLIYEMDKWRY